MKPGHTPGYPLTDLDTDRLAVAFGTGIGGVWTLLDSWDNLRERGPRRVLPMTVPMLMPNGAAAAISMDLSARGGAMTTVLHAPPVPKRWTTRVASSKLARQMLS